MRSGLRLGRRVGWAVGYGGYRVLRRVGRPVLGPVVQSIRARRRPPEEPESATAAPATRPQQEPVDPRLAELAGSRLVIAEAPEAAVAAVNSGVPPAVVWLLAIPPERSAAGEPAGWAAELREATRTVGGLITDSLDAAGILERVVGPVRTAVFPPLAADRLCPVCAGSGAERPVDIFPVDVPAHLRLWRALLAEDADSDRGPTPYSYPVERLRGPAGPWSEPERDTWGTPPEPVVTDPAPDWSSRAQLAAAEELLSTLPPASVESVAPLRVRVFGNDMKFMRDLAAALDRRPDLDVAVDEWRSAGARNDGISENLARSAQVLVAEWARPNARWLSEVKRSDQRLIVRLHRFELESGYPRQIAIDAVDAVVYIAPWIGRRIVDELGWPADKLVYIPNYVDLRRLDRPKYPDARFTLGMLGAVPGLKRFDLALDLLAEVRRVEPRFTLLLRTQQGWAHKPSWERASERRQLQRSLERVEKDPLLRGAVAFDSYGSDIPAWFRKVGHILSLSDVEGSHQALTEGMASGAVPVLRGWPGAAEAYGAEWISHSRAEAVERVLSGSDPGRWAELSARAKTDIRKRFDDAGVLAAWSDLVAGRMEAARAWFPVEASVDVSDRAGA